MRNHVPVIACPVSAERVNEYVVRIVACCVVLIAVTGIVLHSYWFFLLLGLDFSSRAFSDGKFSLLKSVSKNAVQLLHLGTKPADAVPKKFAAGMGFAFSLLIAGFLYDDLFLQAGITSAVLIICAVLESAAGICVGCIVYSFAILPFRK